jgi:regulatory protein
MAFAPKKTRPVKTPTPQYLHNAALYYLGRYAASSKGLQRVLENKIRRAAMRDPDFAADKTRHEMLRRAITDLIAKFTAHGLLNDKAFTEMKVTSLRRQGRSARIIQQKLQAKGIDNSASATALEHYDNDHDNAELQAALRLAKKKRLGKFRTVTAKPDQMRKDIATLARAGFSFAIIKQVLDSAFNESDFD